MSASITPNSRQAWMMSFALHVLVIGLIVLFTYATRLTPEEQPRIFELVAGPGEDYTAKEAPALGNESSVKLAIPKATLPAPTPIQPALPLPSPVLPATPPVKKETPKTVPKKEPDPAKDIAKDLKSRVQQADRKAKKDAAIQRKKEEARLTKEQFDKMNAAKKVASASPPKNAPTKFKPIDAKGIASGVVGGSSASKAGAGGKALTREEATLLELYYSEFRRRLREAFEEDRPTSLSDALVVTIDVHSNPDGSLTSPRITKSSGSTVFDNAVLTALRRMKMPPRPDKRGETISFIFRMRDPD